MKKSLRLVLSSILIIAFVVTSLGFATIAVKSIKLNTSTISLQVGKTYPLKVSFTPANTTQKILIFSTDNKSVAIVDKNGLVKGIGAGKAAITVISSVNKKVLAKCNVSVSKAVSSKPVKLVYYYGGYIGNDNNQVFEEANKIIKSEINATVDFKPLTMGEYNQKMTLIVAAGEYYDLHQSGGLRQPYITNTIRGAYMELDTLLNKYGSWFKNNIPQEVMEGMKVNGKIYAVPNYQIICAQHGIVFQKDIVDKYKLDVKNIKKADDLTSIYETVKKNEPDMIMTLQPSEFAQFDTFDNKIDEPYKGIGIGIDKSFKVIDTYSDPNFINDIKRFRLYYEKGYIPKDIATIKNQYELWSTGKVFAGYSAVKPGGEAQLKAQFGGRDVVLVPTAQPFISTYMITATITAINSASKKADKAMMFLNLLNSNKVLNNILFFGIEGKHYKKVSENRIEPVQNSEYKSYQWAIGTQFNAYLLPGQADDVWEKTKKMNLEAKGERTLGFVFDPSKVMPEIAALSSIQNDDYKIIQYGLSPDVEGNAKKIMEKRAIVGLQKVIDEMQRQLDQWRKSNNK